MRLFWQVYLASLAFVLFSMALLTSVVSYRDSQYALAGLRNEQRLLAVTAASQVESGYHENIWPFGMLWAISKEPQFAFWQIVDSDGRTVLSDGALDVRFSGSDERLREPRWAPALGGGGSGEVEEWVVPMSLGSAATPWLFRLGFKTDGVREFVWHTIGTNVLVALGIALLLIGVSFIFTHRLLGPLRSLTAAARELQHGNLEIDLPTDQSDEFGQLMRAFGSMAAGVRQRDAAIQRHLESLRGAHDDLEEREARLRAVIEHAADGIVSANAQGAVEVFNPSAVRIFGYGPEEITGRPLALLLADGYSIDAGGALVDRIGPNAESLGASAEIHGRRKDGTVFPLQIAVSDVAVGDGRRLRTAIVRDISERRRAEEERKEMHARLVQASRQAGMAEVATSVLHNVGNVLNSVNVSATLLTDAMRGSKVGGLGRAAALMAAHADDLGEFMTAHASGRLLPAYLQELAQVLEFEQAAALKELASLVANIEHMKAVVTQQQTYARSGAAVLEEVDPAALCEDALKICGAEVSAAGIRVVREYASLPTVQTDRHKLLQIMVNLVSNAKHALASNLDAERLLRIRTGLDDQGMLVIRIVDNGVGIAPENLLKIFNYGFTTKKAGHGFGLHSSALAAEQMGGALSAESDGPGHGAAFMLRVPTRPKDAPMGRKDLHEHAS